MQSVISTYSFNATNETVDFSSTVNFNISKLYRIVHNKSNTIIYEKGNVALGYSFLNGSLLGLKFDTFLEGMLSDDTLTVYYDVDAVFDETGATSAKQDIGNNLLSSVDGKLPVLNGGNLPVTPNVAKGAGAIDSNTQRVVLASDGPAVSTLASIDTKTPTPVQRTASYIRSTTTGTIAAGAKSISFGNAGNANATVMTVVLAAGEIISFDAPNQDTLSAISYVATGTTLLITTVV